MNAIKINPALVERALDALGTFEQNYGELWQTPKSPEELDDLCNELRAALVAARKAAQQTLTTEPAPAPAFVYSGQTGRELEEALEGFTHGTAFYTKAVTNQESSALRTPLTEEERTELLDWVSACQSAYSMEQNPRGPFFALPGQLKENRESLVEYVNEILESRVSQRQPLQSEN